MKRDSIVVLLLIKIIRHPSLLFHRLARREKHRNHSQIQPTHAPRLICTRTCLQPTVLVPAPVLSDERLSSGSSPRPIVASVSSIGDNIHQGAETSSNHTCPSNQSQITMSLLPDNGSSPATNPVRSGPSPGFPLPNPVPWVAVPQHTVPSQLIVVLAQDPISRVPPITINISNIGNSNETTTIE